MRGRMGKLTARPIRIPPQIFLSILRLGRYGGAVGAYTLNTLPYLTGL